MIRFPCPCGHWFSLEDEQSGGLIQCPACQRLNDVPTLDELASLAPDGTLTLKGSAQKPEPDRIAEVSRYFGRERFDASGREKDLRPTLEQLSKAGVKEVPLETRTPPSVAAPRYDPVTGELIRPMQLAPAAHEAAAPAGPRAVIPIARAVLTYATGERARLHNPWRILLDLCAPSNAFVLFFIFCFHVLAQFVAVSIAGGFYFVAPVLLILCFALVAHYANVIDETGPHEMDELPRPFRQVSWHEDLWGPFVHSAVGFFVCYWPVWAAFYLPAPEKMRLLVAGFLLIAGGIFFPAALLTTVTSGSLPNLRPDRVITVMLVGGWRYVLAVLSWFVACAVYVVSMALSAKIIIQLYTTKAKPNGIEWAVTYTLLGGAIVLMHFFCWELGLLYRVRHNEFGWTLQCHEPRNATKMHGAELRQPGNLGRRAKGAAYRNRA